jgi:hypothetical protein
MKGKVGGPPHPCALLRCAAMGPTLPTLLLVTAVALLPTAARGQGAVACNDEHGSCREDCTLEFGSSSRTRAQLGRCLEACSATHQRCASRWHELQGAQLEPVPEPSPAPSPARAVSAAAQTPPPAPQTEDAPARARQSAAPSANRTRYAPSDPEEQAAPPPSPASAYRVDTEDYNEGILLPADAQLAQPAPVAPPPSQARQSRDEPAAKTAPAPAPVAPKRKPRSGELVEPEHDISDWDPN